MSYLDPHSIVAVATVLLLLCAAILASLRRKLPAAIRGSGWWAVGTVVIAFASVLIGQRERLPEWLTSVLGNGMLWAGMSLCVVGLRRFAGRSSPAIGLAIGGIAFMAASAWSSLLYPDYPIRLACNASFFIMMYLILIESTESVRPHNWPVKFLMGCFCFAAGVALLRLLAVLAGLDQTESLFSPTPHQRIFLVSYGMTWLLANVAFILMVHERLYSLLRHAATYDPLSGLINRGAVMMMLEREMDRASRNGGPLSVLMVDIDHFKQINDSFGHAVGDRTIVDFAKRAALHLRRSDVLGRYGGEEFLALLPDTDATIAAQVAERVRACIEAEAGTDPRYTVSIGIACFAVGMTTDALVRFADEALYRAKQGGRNRIEGADRRTDGANG